jgi:hypothetical protein
VRDVRSRDAEAIVIKISELSALFLFLDRDRDFNRLFPRTTVPLLSLASSFPSFLLSVFLILLPSYPSPSFFSFSSSSPFSPPPTGTNIFLLPDLLIASLPPNLTYFPKFSYPHSPSSAPFLSSAFPLLLLLVPFFFPPLPLLSFLLLLLFHLQIILILFPTPLFIILFLPPFPRFLSRLCLPFPSSFPLSFFLPSNSYSIFPLFLFLPFPTSYPTLSLLLFLLLRG